MFITTLIIVLYHGAMTSFPPSVIATDVPDLDQQFYRILPAGHDPARIQWGENLGHGGYGRMDNTVEYEDGVAEDAGLVTVLKNRMTNWRRKKGRVNGRNRHSQTINYLSEPTTTNDITRSDMPSSSSLLRRYIKEFLREFQTELLHRKHVLASAEWNFQTNLTNWNSLQLAKEQSKFSDWWKARRQILRRFKTETLPEALSRQIRMALSTISLTSKEPLLSEEISRLQSELVDAFSSAKVCMQGENQTCMALEPGLVDLMGRSRDSSVLAEAWLKWRHVTGEPMRQRYSHLVTLLNRMARENGFSDYSRYEMQQGFFETPELDNLQTRLWKEAEPLYLHLHAYVRRRLKDIFGGGVIGNDGTLPAHLLGNMWAQNWQEIYSLVVPYPEVDVFGDVEAALSSSRNDSRWMFSLVEGFYKSLGLPPMTKAFWEKSVISKPTDRPVDCHAKAFDMFHRKDFRIKMCAKPTFKDLLTVFHEMGHVGYAMSYAHQPTVFRTGANLATHESIGDMVQLAMLTSPYEILKDFNAQQMVKMEAEDEEDGGDEREEKREKKEKEEKIRSEDKENMRRIIDSRDDKLWDVEKTRGMRNDKKMKYLNIKSQTKRVDEEHGEEEDTSDDIENKKTINKLLYLALKKVAFLPFGYIVDRWRYEVMRGDVSPKEYNKRWWELRLEYQGIRSPFPRSERDFDPGSKYHVIFNSMFSGYYLAQFQQFQLFSSLCREKEKLSQEPPSIHGDPQVTSSSADKLPLHQCNIYGSKEATHKLRRFLNYGSSIPWQDQLLEFTGDVTVTSDAMLTYFKPLHQWLKGENSNQGEILGWRGAEINWEE